MHINKNQGIAPCLPQLRCRALLPPLPLLPPLLLLPQEHQLRVAFCTQHTVLLVSSQLPQLN